MSEMCLPCFFFFAVWPCVRSSVSPWNEWVKTYNKKGKVSKRDALVLLYWIYTERKALCPKKAEDLVMNNNKSPLDNAEMSRAGMKGVQISRTHTEKKEDVTLP